MAKIFASVINYNNAQDTLECLKSLRTLNKKDIELSVIITDNASVKPFKLNTSDFKSLSIEIIHNSTNLGFSGGHNIAIKKALQANADYLLVLNNDTRVDRELLVKLLERGSGNKDIGIIVPKIYFEKGNEFHKDRYKNSDLGKVIWYAGGYIDWENLIGTNIGVDEVDSGQYNKPVSVEIATGCCMLISKTVLEKVGFFDERYFLYYEDTDFSMRVKKFGYQIAYQPESILWHKNAGSSGGSGSKLQDYFISRNRMLFGMKYSLFSTKLALLRESIYLIFKGREWQKKGVKDYYLRRFGKGSFNI